MNKTKLQESWQNATAEAGTLLQLIPTHKTEMETTNYYNKMPVFKGLMWMYKWYLTNKERSVV